VDVNLTFLNNVTDQPEYNYVHYRDAKGQPVALDIDALQSYDLVINTCRVRQANLPIRAGGKASSLTNAAPCICRTPGTTPTYGRVQAAGGPRQP
jgi:Ca-activated chloride channel family protein